VLEAFRICERTFKGDSIDYNEQGLPWTLDRIRVKFNILHTELRRDNKQHGATPGLQCALNRLSAGIIFGTKTISGGGKLIEPQAGAEVKPLSVAHRKSGRTATARVVNWRRQLPFSIAQGRLGRSATTPSTPGESGAVAGTPEPFAAPQNWENQPSDNRYQAVKPPDSQRETDAQLSATDTRHRNGKPPRGHLRLDSFGIFAQGEQELRKLQASAIEASTKGLGRSGTFSLRVPFGQ